MATTQPQTKWETADAENVVVDDDPVKSPTGWKRLLEDPLNTYYRYPVAKALVRVLMHTPVTPNQVTLVQPLFAGLAGYLLTFNDWRYLVGAAVAFEIRSILDCADGTLARAKKLSSESGHAIDAMADWLGVVLLYAGIFTHFNLYPPTMSGPLAYLWPFDGTWAVNGLLALSLFVGAWRSFASDYYKTKYISIFERGKDETVSALRDKLAAIKPDSSPFAHIEIFILRMGHLSFEHQWFRAESSRSSIEAEQVPLVQKHEKGKARVGGILWSLTNGDFFLSLIILSLVLNQLWAGQVLLATAGFVWTFLVVWYNGAFIRSFRGAKA